MTLEDINYIAQTVGVVAILGTFVAVLIQMRQTNRLLRNQAKRAQIDGIKAISEATYQTPGLADTLVRGIAGGLDGITIAERGGRLGAPCVGTARHHGRSQHHL